jgi:hypothetical protein
MVSPLPWIVIVERGKASTAGKSSKIAAQAGLPA